jgi:hypothetical protein
MVISQGYPLVKYAEWLATIERDTMIWTDSEEDSTSLDEREDEKQFSDDEWSYTSEDQEIDDKDISFGDDFDQSKDFFLPNNKEGIFYLNNDIDMV